MPEGPSIIIIKETLCPLIKGKKVKAVRGNAKLDPDRMLNKKLVDIRTWGKHLLLCFPGFTVRIHFLLFGSYSMGEQTKPDRSLRLALTFGKRTVYFYTCAIRYIEEDLDEIYDWEADVLNANWNPSKARKKLKEKPKSLACDILLDQDIFSGVGNIIKNEVLYRIRLHPETRVKNIPSRKLSELVREASHYSFDFLKWKKELTLKKHWLAHTKKECTRCQLPIIKKHCGKTARRTFLCKNCQVLYK